MRFEAQDVQNMEQKRHLRTELGGTATNSLFYPRDEGAPTVANWPAVMSFQDYYRLLSSPLEYSQRP